MSVLINKGTKVMIQGITGRFGQFVARNMLDTGTNVVVGVTPGRGGQNVGGIPVCEAVREAWDIYDPIDASVILVPGPQAKEAMQEAVGFPFQTILLEVERVSIHDILNCITHARKREFVSSALVLLVWYAPGKDLSEFSAPRKS